MSRRIELELTSKRDDGTWNWRAAGAREPKGVLDGGLLADDAAVGQVLKVDAEFGIDGIEVVAVLPPTPERPLPETLEIIGTRRDEPDVLTTGVSKRGRRDDDGPAGKRERKKRRSDGPRDSERRRRKPEPEKPKPKRLRPKKEHRTAWLESLPEEQKPVAEQLILGGIPAVRAAIEKQNAAARESSQPEVNADPLLAMAENLMPTFRVAEWRDRADAALADVAELDLRDLRSLLNAAEAVQRDEQCRAQADELRAKLTERVDREHNAWLAEIAATLADGRTVRALRLSSRPPKAGAPLPSDLASRLAEAASAGLSKEATQDRYATVLDAVAYSPVRQLVKPQAIPESPNEELLKTVRKVADRIPEIAAEFGVKPSERPHRGTRGSKSRAKPKPPPKASADTKREVAPPEVASEAGAESAAEATPPDEAPETRTEIEPPAADEAPETSTEIEPPAADEAPDSSTETPAAAEAQ